MILSKKIAIIYGAGGAVGSVVAETFAREGAKVFLTGRTKAKVDRVAEKINAAGRFAESAEIAAFIASDHASAMTGTIVNMSLGSIAD